ncbi:MAG: hypothetical protein Q9175_007012, partial [Cornicularia normoerica]
MDPLDLELNNLDRNCDEKGILDCRSGARGHGPHSSLLAEVVFFLGDEQSPGYGADKVHAFGCALRYLWSEIAISSLKISLTFHAFGNSAQLSGFASALTPIPILCDDHVFWQRTFLPSILAPFEDPTVGYVGTNKRVHRTIFIPNFRNFLSCLYLERHNFEISATNFRNFLGSLYLERHNFEIAATNTVDEGVLVDSGRTSAHRTLILKNQSSVTASPTVLKDIGNLAKAVGLEVAVFITYFFLLSPKSVHYQTWY